MAGTASLKLTHWFPLTLLPEVDMHTSSVGAFRRMETRNATAPSRAEDPSRDPDSTVWGLAIYRGVTGLGLEDFGKLAQVTPLAGPCRKSHCLSMHSQMTAIISDSLGCHMAATEQIESYSNESSTFQ